MSPSEPMELDSVALKIVALFAVAQGAIDDAVEAYMRTRLAEPFATPILKRLRLSDEERLIVAVGLAESLEIRFPAEAFKMTYRHVKAARDLIAHGGVFELSADEHPGFYGLGQRVAARRKAEPGYLESDELQWRAEDAAWLSEWTRILDQHAAGEADASAVMPSDVTDSSVLMRLSKEGLRTGPPCEAGHAPMNAVNTFYGEGWQCGECRLVRLHPTP
jgi:hypothetical protein